MLKPITTLTVTTPDPWVRRGEFTTVWLGDFEDEGGRTQVEIALLSDGTKRICLPKGAAVTVTTFDEVY